jgi:hypothetical protein
MIQEVYLIQVEETNTTVELRRELNALISTGRQAIKVYPAKSYANRDERQPKQMTIGGEDPVPTTDVGRITGLTSSLWQWIIIFCHDSMTIELRLQTHADMT